MLALAIAGYILAFGSGYIAADLAVQNGLKESTVIAGHHVLGRLGLITIFLVGGAAWLEGAALPETRLLWQRIYRTLLLVAALITFVVCYRGGELVFTHGVGVARDALNK